MAMLVRQGSTWRTITGGDVFASGAWRPLAAVKVYASGAWRTVATFASSGGGGGGGGGSSLTISLSGTTISGSGASSSITSGTVTATPSGGFVPYHYIWSLSDGDGLATYTINSPNSATTTVTASGVPSETTVTGSITCAVTDAAGTTGLSGQVDCTFIRSGSPGSPH